MNNSIIYKIKSLAIGGMIAIPLMGGGLLSSCSDDYMAEINTDETKATEVNPNVLLTTALLEPYGDMDLMDTYRNYITGFTQHVAGGWNVMHYAGSVYADDEYMAKVWNKYYSVGMKNLVDGINNSSDRPNLNAVMRIHKVYMMSVLTDIYGDIPCSEACKGYTDGISNPKYDKQEEIYKWFFTELKACVEQLGTGTDNVTGDVTSLGGSTNMWKRYANSLRMRFAMRISDVAPELAQQEFEAAINDPAGYINSADYDAYTKFMDAKFTLYDGAKDLDFRINALGEILYGQDPTSPALVCKNFYDMLNGDPRQWRICRHYFALDRSESYPDEGNIDVTDEVEAFLTSKGLTPQLARPGEAWYNVWPSTTPSLDDLPTLKAKYTETEYTENNFYIRMLFPFVNNDLLMPNRPGYYFTSAEANFLLAEAKAKGWNVPGDAIEYYQAGIRASMAVLNGYLTKNKITEAEINDYISTLPTSFSNYEEARKCINTQAYILHFTNPSEAWANLRRSDYPAIIDRTQYTAGDAGDNNKQTPTRLKYPVLEKQYNSDNYNTAIQDLGGTDDWHSKLWWDKYDVNVY